MGAISLLLVLAPFILDEVFRDVLAKHDWASREFKVMASGLALWTVVGLAFLLAALFIKKANIWGLILLTLCNAIILALVWPGAAGKDIVLVPPLCLSLLALLFEDYKNLSQAKRKTA
jgi:ACR3 family arsenite efflux pump ArsB